MMVMVAQQAAVERKGAPVMYYVTVWAPMSVPFIKIGRTTRPPGFGISRRGNNSRLQRN
jgi:hypothetical protein